MTKINIFFIQPLFYDPTLPNFKDKFEMLSQYLEGHVVSATTGNYGNLRFGDIVYHPLPYIQNKVRRYVCHLWRIVRLGWKVDQKKKFDYVHCYDPLFFGFAGVLVSLLTGAELIVEVNGYLGEAGFLKSRGVRDWLKKCVFFCLIRIAFGRARIIKFLNGSQTRGLEKLLREKRTVVFHDFVPTHVFSAQKSRDEGYILFIGHPFYLKGVDILIQAFNKISPNFPDIRLKIVGHCHGGDKERNAFVEMAQGNPRVEVLKPVFYPEAVKLFQGCAFFVLPSRSEAMGRVLIEAMAAGKAVVGSRVGGIPSLIKEGENGLLFESEDVIDLSKKLQHLLSSADDRLLMGKKGLEMAMNKFSSKHYVTSFLTMLEGS